MLETALIILSGLQSVFSTLEPFAKLFALGAVLYTAFGQWRGAQKVAIVASDGDRKKIVSRLPRRAVTRAEVLGLVAQAAGGARLDFSGFDLDYDFGNEVVVPLTAADFEKLR